MGDLKQQTVSGVKWTTVANVNNTLVLMLKLLILARLLEKSDFGIIAIVLAIFLIAGHKPDIYWAQLPFYALLMFLFFTTWSLFAGMLSVISKDFMNLVKSVTTALFWLSGVMYDVLRVKNAILLSFLRYNPVTYVVYGYRNSLVYKIWFWEDPRYLLNIGIVYAVLLALALWVYRRTIRSISDIL